MTGWRIGYVIAQKEHVDRITKLNQITINNVPVFIQEAALKGLELQKQLATKIKNEYQQRAKMASKHLKEAGLEFTEPEAPVYVFPPQRGLDSERVTVQTLDQRRAGTPGPAIR